MNPTPERYRRGRATGAGSALALLAALAAGAAAAAELLVKGLTDGSAIVELDGQLVILREGEVRRGIRLLAADNERAVLEFRGRRLTLGLDQSIAKTYRKPEPSRSARAGTAFLYQARGRLGADVTGFSSVKLIDEQDDRVVVGVEYVYPGDYGENVYLEAATLRNGSRTGFSAVPQSRILRGKHYLEIAVAMDPNAPLVYVSDALRVAIYWSQDGQRQGDIAERVVPFDKYWKKVPVR